MKALVAAVVLAAGTSRRMAPRNKLLIRDAGGQTMVGRVVAAALASAAHRVVVVTGHEAPAVAAALRELRGFGRAPLVVRAPGFASGMSASLRAGLAAVPPCCGAALVCLADMKLVTPTLLNRLIAAYDPAAGHLIVVPCCLGQRGNPVLWDRRFFAPMRGVHGDRGARSLLSAHAAHVRALETGDEAVLRDFDTPAALET